MIPNRFDDYTNEPHYNTVDASLWFIHAAFEYRRFSGDERTFNEKLLPACQADHSTAIARHALQHQDGAADGLITQGDPTTQLTWMDAKMGDIAFTPREGKARGDQRALVSRAGLDGRERRWRKRSRPASSRRSGSAHSVAWRMW